MHTIRYLAPPHGSFLTRPNSSWRIVMRRIPAALVLLASSALLSLVASPADAQAKRALRSGDLYHLKDVRDPQISPDGGWVAYRVSTVDSAKDKPDNDIWLT